MSKSPPRAAVKTEKWMTENLQPTLGFCAILKSSAEEGCEGQEKSLCVFVQLEN